jgi:hypothetical protein
MMASKASLDDASGKAFDEAADEPLVILLASVAANALPPRRFLRHATPKLIIDTS